MAMSHLSIQSVDDKTVNYRSSDTYIKTHVKGNS